MPQSARAQGRPTSFQTRPRLSAGVGARGRALTRAGHTEAGCDLARLAGLEPAAVLVEILNEDGTMARRPDLERFAEAHGLKLGTIADLIKYRMLHEKTVERAGECRLPTEFGEFRLVAFRARTDDRIHYALVAGEIDPDVPTLIRGPPARLAQRSHRKPAPRRRVAGWRCAAPRRRGGKRNRRHTASPRNPPTKSWRESIPTVVRTKENHSRSMTRAADLRTLGLGAQILADLGVRKMRVLSAPKRLHAISGFGLEVVEYVDESHLALSGDERTRVPRVGDRRDSGRAA